MSYYQMHKPVLGNHHEEMDGDSYPRGLNSELLSAQARMGVRAITNVFELIASSNGAYKKAKTLIETIEIMTHMVTIGRIVFFVLDNDSYQDYATYSKIKNSTVK
ncbi:HD domain-containing phosphohydrolase [Vibrio aestuarianus]|uniref:HD domain-containing phosphohydrolase n=1 Tax=Vibrio aestuarianus TaxID=28171 RepID=UPI0021C30580|nr:HD domain-containing phosphohydrolase [Vibrio aestuarianus]